jgi:hypothetical protein
VQRRTGLALLRICPRMLERTIFLLADAVAAVINQILTPFLICGIVVAFLLCVWGLGLGGGGGETQAPNHLKPSDSKHLEERKQGYLPKKKKKNNK